MGIEKTEKYQDLKEQLERMWKEKSKMVLMVNCGIRGCGSQTVAPADY